MRFKDYLTVEPYGYQKVGIGFALSHHYCIIGDDMGLGKTLQAIAVAAIINKRTVVVCPAYLKRNWEYEFKKFAPQLTVQTCYRKSDLQKSSSAITIISYSQLRHATEIFAGARVVIADEVHYLKNPDAKRTDLFHDLLDGSSPDYFLGLSGTPIKNRVQEYYSILGLCSYNPRGTSGKKVLKDFSYWKFCNKTTLKISGRRITKFEGTRNIPLLKEYLKDKFIRRTSDKVLDLPDMIEKEVMVDYKKHNDKELEEAWEQFNNGSKEHVSKAKRASAIAKAKFTAEYAKDLHEETGKPILIFTDHPDAAKFIAETLGCARGIITGATNADKRHQIVEEFQREKLPFICATIGSASTGFNMTATNHVIFNDYSWVNADNSQAKKRIHRIGQGERCIAHIIVGSRMDLMIWKTLQKKGTDLRRLL